MLFSNISQLAVLLLLLLVGWLFGFASHPGGKRWRNAYNDEALGRAQDRDELDAQLRAGDARIATLEQDKAALTAELDQARRTPPVAATIAPPAAPVPAPTVVAQPVPEPEPAPVYLSRIVPEAPVVSGPVAASAARPAFPPRQPEPVAVAVAAPATAAPVEAEHTEVPPAAEPAEPLPIKRGWFDWGKSDELTELRGVDAELEAKLKAENVDRFSEIANLTDQEEIALERRLDLPAGYLMKEQLREQARLLADGDTAGHAERFGAI